MSIRRLIVSLIGDIDDLTSLKLPMVKKSNEPHIYTEQELLELESNIGAQLFGPVPAGRRREFFCMDEKNWIWYEEWKDDAGKAQRVTVRYELHENGVLKVQEGARYSYLQGTELDNFVRATKAYHDQVLKVIYKQLPVAA